MEPGIDREEFIIRDFARRKRIQYILMVPVALVVILALVVRANDSVTFGSLSQDTVIYLLLGVVLATVIYSFYNWRCPACKKYLGRGLGQSYCPSCGAKFRREG